MFKPSFWKLSHGYSLFSFADMIRAANEGFVYLHANTGPLGSTKTSQSDHFISAPIGDYFYLTHGNQGIYLLGQFSGPANIFSSYGDGWMDRPFRLIRSAKDGLNYDDNKKWWSPNFNSSFARVPDDEVSLFESKILTPFFGISLSDFGI